MSKPATGNRFPVKQPASYPALALMTLGVLALVLAACSGSATPSVAGQAPASSPTALQAAEAGSGTAPTATGESAPAVPAAVSFVKDVLPILQSRCVNCHGGQRTEKGLVLTSYKELMAGSENGSVVTAGDVTGSRLVQLVVEGKMPKRGPKLTPVEVQILTDWVTAGAQNN